MILYLDLPLDADDPPERGDVLLGPNNAYRVLEVRPTDSRVWANRWTVHVDPLGPFIRDAAGHAYPPQPAPGGRHYEFSSYRRGETPAQHFGAA